MSKMEYPCDHILKVVGLNKPGFLDQILEVVCKHMPFEQNSKTVSSRTSRDDKYLSLTLNLFAESREQLDTLYEAISEHEWVQWVM